MDSRLVVVGLTGVAGSGKDTVASILGLHHGFTRIALGDGVKSALRDLDGLSCAFTKELGAGGLSSREAWQMLGGDAREDLAHATMALDINLAWTYVVGIKIAYCLRRHPVRRHRFVVPDISYKHEIAVLGHIAMALGGTYATWRIERPGAGLRGKAGQHASEQGRASLPADRTIDNDRDIRQLAQAVDDAVLPLLGTAKHDKNVTCCDRPICAS